MLDLRYLAVGAIILIVALLAFGRLSGLIEKRN